MAQTHYDPNDTKSRIDDSYDDMFDQTDSKSGRAKELQQLEKLAYIRDNNPDAIAAREQQGWDTNYERQEETPKKRSAGERVKGFFKATKKKTSAWIIGLILAGVMGGTGFFLGSSLAPIMFVQNLNLDLKDTLSAYTSRMKNQFVHKIVSKKSATDNTSFGCTAVGSAISRKCRLKTIAPWTETKLKGEGIEVIGEKKLFGRIEPEGYKFKGVTYDAESFSKAIKGEVPELWHAYTKAINANWLSVKAKTFIGRVLPKFGRNSDQPIELTGTEEEMNKQLRDGKTGGDTGETTFRRATDENGKELTDPATGEELWKLDGDESGEIFRNSEKETALKATEDVKGFKTSLSETSVKALGKLNLAVSVMAIPDALCTVRNLIGQASIATKIGNAKQYAEYAMRYLPLVGMLQAGDINNPAVGKAVQSFVTDADTREFITDFAMKGTNEKDAKVNPTKIKNPNYGKNAMDSRLYKMSAGGGTVTPSDIEKNYSLGLEAKSTMQSIANGVVGIDRGIVNTVNFDACNAIQSLPGRGLSFLGGVVVNVVGVVTSPLGIGVGVLGLKTAQAVAALYIAYKGSAIANHMINAAMTSSVIPDTMRFLSLDRAAAVWTGASVLYGGEALARGMMPGNADQIIAYQQEQNVARQEVIALEREKSSPLDINNPYSLSGSVLASIGTHLPTSLSTSSFSSVVSGLSSFVFGGITSSLKPYSAYAASVDPSRYKQCNDPLYKDIGIDADVQCNVRYVMPEASMKIDSLEAAQYMEDNGFVEPDTTTGYPVGYSPPDAEKEGSEPTSVLQKVGADLNDFVKGTVNSVYNTDNYGKYDVSKQDTDGKEIGSPHGSKFAAYLNYCVYRALPFGMTYEDNGVIGGVGREWLSGSACRSITDPDINNFRTYVFDMSVDQDLDGPIIPDCLPSMANSTVNDSDNSTTATAIDAIIAKYPSSPLNGKGSLIMEYAKKYGVRADFFVTTFLAENQFATDNISTQLYKDSFNIGNNKAGDSDVGDCGTTSYGGSTYKKYCSLESGIEGAFKSIAENGAYKDKLPTQNPLPDTKPNTIGSVRQIYCPEGDGGTEGCNLENFLAMGKSLGFTMSKDDAFYTSASANSTTSTSSGNRATGTKMSESELKTLITSYKLPAPQGSNSNGAKGYTELLSNLTSNPNAGWAAQQFLNGEKTWKSKGGNVKEYLTTAWVWSENGAEVGPDPYEMNCNNQTESTKATATCGGNFQVAGYQATTRANDYVEVFKKLYSDTELPSVMKSVIDNSSKASKDIWKYSDPSNSSASSYYSNLNGITLNDIAPNGNFSNEKTQVLTLILGKDPTMAAALNSFAVSDDDLVKALKAGGCLYGDCSYYNETWKQQLSNMVMALYMFDGSGPSSAVCGKASNPRGSGTGIAAIFNGTVPSITQEFGPTGFSAKNFIMYAYAAAYGMNPVGHTGIDYGVELDTKLYSPVDGIVEVDGGTPYFRSTDRLNGDVSQPGTGQLSIKMGNGDTVILGHMHKIDVKVGDKVTKGQYVGLSGIENGPHVHVEYRTPDKSTLSGELLVDPRKYL